MNFSAKQLNQSVIGIPLLLFVYFVICRSYVIVNAGNVGIKKTFGAVQMKELPEGLHLIKPFIDDVYHMDCRIQGVDAQTKASSQDLQMVETEMSLQYHVKPSVAPLLYQKVGTRDIMQASIIFPAIKESVKAVTAKWTAEELITQRQEVKVGIKADILHFINHTLSAKHIPDGIQVANVAITDFSFSHEFNHAIEMKVKAEQEALMAENEKNTTITRAEAQSEKVKIAASASAYRVSKVADARANAISVEALALKNKPELLQLRLLERWSGLLPKYNGAGGGILLNIGSGN